MMHVQSPQICLFVCFFFNRNEMILLYDLKQAAGNCEFEIQSLK